MNLFTVAHTTIGTTQGGFTLSKYIFILIISFIPLVVTSITSNSVTTMDLESLMATSEFLGLNIAVFI